MSIGDPYCWLEVCIGGVKTTQKVFSNTVVDLMKEGTIFWSTGYPIIEFEIDETIYT